MAVTHDALAVQRAQASEMPVEILIAELERRGYTVGWSIETIHERAARFRELLDASRLPFDAERG